MLGPTRFSNTTSNLESSSLHDQSNPLTNKYRFEEENLHRPYENKKIRLCLDDVVDHKFANLQIKPSQSKEEMEISNQDFSLNITQEERVAIVQRMFMHIKRQVGMKGISNQNVPMIEEVQEEEPLLVFEKVGVGS